MNVFPRTNLRALFQFAFFLLPFAGAAQDPAPDLSANPAVATPPLNPALPTLFIAGDSTAAKANGQPVQGWGARAVDAAAARLSPRGTGTGCWRR